MESLPNKNLDTDLDTDVSNNNIEVEPKDLRDNLLHFLKIRNLDSKYKPEIIRKGANGEHLSVEIYEGDKSVFVAYNVAEPFRIGKERILENAKEAISHWIDDGMPEGLKVGQPVSDGIGK